MKEKRRIKRRKWYKVSSRYKLRHFTAPAVSMMTVMMVMRGRRGTKTMTGAMTVTRGRSGPETPPAPAR
ncbi:hypothetical protein E2C01_095594 [Portunus trituberculatus]|uniref:Uncharacterized protein n=1 Tax=Portunus trituberculatus TaxID=210409 RepID=A0A5B7JTE8_PORTR|nr:hypothetical protein [Portunus trituberculatus]